MLEATECLAKELILVGVNLSPCEITEENELSCRHGISPEVEFSFKVVS